MKKTSMIGHCVAVLLAAMALTAACSDSGGSADPDAGTDGGTAPPIDGPLDGTLPPADCLQKQRAYVDRVIPPDRQTDVATTVSAILGASDFPQAMPYCLGPRP